MPIQVNYYNKIVYITSPTTTVTVQELVDAIRTAEDTPEGISFGGSVATMVDAVIDAEGKAGVGGGFLAGIVMTLKSDWYIEFWDGVVLGTVSGGNVTGGLADRPVRCAVGSADTALQLGAVGGVIAETGVSGLTTEESDALLAIELATDNIPGDVWSEGMAAYTAKGSAGATQMCQLYDNMVSYDSINGEAGTAYPIGTHRYPVDNLTDALVIAVARNLDTLLIHSDMTIGATDNVDGMIFMSEGRMGTTVTLTAGCSVNGAAFRYLNLQGEMTNGDVLLVESCSLPNSLINFSGIMNVVAFADGAELHVGSWATLINCNAGGEPTNEPEIDVNASSTTINGWNGNIKITGKTASNRTTVNLMAGNIIIDSTCIAGTIQLMGVGYLEADNSGVGCDVDQEAFISRPQIAIAVWDENLADHVNDETTGHAMMQLAYGGKIFIDTVNGSAGTVYPVGIRQHPVKTIADALVIGANYDLATIHILGALTISGGEDLSGFTFTSDRSIGNILNIVSAVTNGTYFDNLTVSGTGNGTVRFTYCVIDGFSDLEGGIKNSLLTNDISYLASSSVKNYMTDCDRFMTLVDTYINIDIADTSFNMIRGRGNYKIIGKTSSDITTLDLNGTILVDSTCTAGTIVIAGLTRVLDESGPGCLVLPAVLTNATIADAAWDELKAGHIEVGSFGEAVQNIEERTDNLPDDPADQSLIEAAITASETNIRGTDSDDLKVLSDQLDLVAPAGEYDSELAAIQADLDDPDQYKADVSALALEATLQLVKTEADKIPSLEILLTFLEDIEGGRWRIENNQMIFYKPDNTTEVARFNLFDAAGDPAEEDVFERQRV